MPRTTCALPWSIVESNSTDFKRGSRHPSYSSHQRHRQPNGYTCPYIHLERIRAMEARLASVARRRHIQALFTFRQKSYFSCSRLIVSNTSNARVSRFLCFVDEVPALQSFLAPSQRRNTEPISRCLNKCTEKPGGPGFCILGSNGYGFVHD